MLFNDSNDIIISNSPLLPRGFTVGTVRLAAANTGSLLSTGIFLLGHRQSALQADGGDKEVGVYNHTVVPIDYMVSCVSREVPGLGWSHPNSAPERHNAHCACIAQVSSDLWLGT